MTDSTGASHGASCSDGFTDPFCDLCYESKGLTVRVYGLCTDCEQFLCTDCHGIHLKLQSCRNHKILRGDEMPQSRAEKSRSDVCDVHPPFLRDQFCCEHNVLLCSSCASSEHKDCQINPVEDASKSVAVSETSAVYDKVNNLQDTLKSVLSKVENNIKKMKEQQKTLIKEAQYMHNQINVILNKLFRNIEYEIQRNCQSQISLLSSQRRKFKDMLVRLDSRHSDLEELKDNSTDTKKLQDIVSYTSQITNELQDLRKLVKSVSFSFTPSQLTDAIWSSSATVGSITCSESAAEADTLDPGIMCTFPMEKRTTAQPHIGQNTKNPADKYKLSKMKAIKQRTFKIRQQDDTHSCTITGMAVTKNGRILMVDATNEKIKLFSQGMKIISTVPVSSQDIALINDKEAIVTTENKSLVAIDISGSQLSMKTTTQLPYDVYGICKYKNKLVVTSLDSKPPSVKLIDKTGTVYWSVTSDQQGQPLFINPRNLTSPDNGKSSTVVVTDWGNHSLTLLNGDTGEVITRCHLKEKCPRGVTTDSAGNVYICYFKTRELSVLSGDLSEERILPSSMEGLSDRPLAIVYDGKTNLLTVSYTSMLCCDNVEQFKITYIN